MYIHGITYDRYPVAQTLVQKPTRPSQPVDSIGILSGDKGQEHSGSERRRQQHHDFVAETMETNDPETGSIINVTG